jgi:hypothetical protein
MRQWTLSIYGGSRTYMPSGIDSHVFSVLGPMAPMCTSKASKRKQRKSPMSLHGDNNAVSDQGRGGVRAGLCLVSRAPRSPGMGGSFFALALRGNSFPLAVNSHGWFLGLTSKKPFATLITHGSSQKKRGPIVGVPCSPCSTHRQASDSEADLAHSSRTGPILNDK